MEISQLKYDLKRGDMSLCLAYGFQVVCNAVSYYDKRVWVEMSRKGRKKIVQDKDGKNKKFDQNQELYKKIHDLYRQEAINIRIRINHLINNPK